MPFVRKTEHAFTAVRKVTYAESVTHCNKAESRQMKVQHSNRPTLLVVATTVHTGLHMQHYLCYLLIDSKVVMVITVATINSVIVTIITTVMVIDTTIVMVVTVITVGATTVVVMVSNNSDHTTLIVRSNNSSNDLHQPQHHFTLPMLIPHLLHTLVDPYRYSTTQQQYHTYSTHSHTCTTLLDCTDCVTARLARQWLVLR